MIIFTARFMSDRIGISNANEKGSKIDFKLDTDKFIYYSPEQTQNNRLLRDNWEKGQPKQC